MTALATLPELETLAEETIEPTLGNQLLDAASATVRTLCGWRIDQDTETLTVDGTPWPTLHLPTLLVTEVDLVTVDGTEVTDYAWGRRGVLRRAGGWGVTLDGVAVTLTHGYEDVPRDIAGVVLALALRTYLNPAGHSAEVLAGASTTYTLQLTEVERAILDRHTLGGMP